jgi:hypothetical protein
MDNLVLSVTLYQNKRIAILLTCEDGEPYGLLTTNLVDADINEDEICIPVWNHTEEFLDYYLATGQFESTGQTRPAGFVDAAVWRVICPKLLVQVAQLRLRT